MIFRGQNLIGGQMQFIGLNTGKIIFAGLPRPEDPGSEPGSVIGLNALAYKNTLLELLESLEEI
jgi:hypothetical protein